MAASSSASRPDGQGDVFYVRANPRRLSMGLDLHSSGQVEQIMQGPLGVDVDNDGKVDVVITPEKLLEFALDHGSAVSAAGQNAVRETRRSSLALSASSHVESLLQPPLSQRRSSIVSSTSSQQQPPPPQQQQQQPDPAPVPVQQRPRTSIRLPPSIVVAPPVYVDSFDPPAPPPPPPKPAPIPVQVEVATPPREESRPPTPSVISHMPPPGPPPLPRPLEVPRWAQRPSGVPLQDLENLPSNVTYSIVQRKIVPDYGPRLFPYQNPQEDARADFYEWRPQSHD